MGVVAYIHFPHRFENIGRNRAGAIIDEISFKDVGIPGSTSFPRRISAFRTTLLRATGVTRSGLSSGNQISLLCISFHDDVVAYPTISFCGATDRFLVRLERFVGPGPVGHRDSVSIHISTMTGLSPADNLSVQMFRASATHGRVPGGNTRNARQDPQPGSGRGLGRLVFASAHTRLVRRTYASISGLRFGDVRRRLLLSWGHARST